MSVEFFKRSSVLKVKGYPKSLLIPFTIHPDKIGGILFWIDSSHELHFQTMGSIEHSITSETLTLLAFFTMPLLVIPKNDSAEIPLFFVRISYR